MAERISVETSLLSAFREEFHQDLAVIRREWEAYRPNRKTRMTDLAELRRLLHTVKGSTRLLGFEGLPEQVHALEELVLEGLRKKKKPDRFPDDLADLEEAVSRFLGAAEVSGEFELEGASPISPGVASPASTAFGFLNSVDELLTLSQNLADEVVRLKAGGSAGHQAVLLVERAKALRQEARRMALVSSSELFVGMTELARRTGEERGKSVRVSYQVQPDYLERDIVQGLRPALLHLVGNAVAHGMKGDSGEVIFAYQRHPHHLVVSVADRGPGLSREELRRAVISAGYQSEAEWESSSPAEQLQWLFHPGVSTRSEADLSAGRGMGLAVVAETVQRLGGRVEVDSGQGTEFRLLIPANWNLRSVLRVRSGDHDFAVLSSDIVGVEALALEAANGPTTVPTVGALSELLGYAGAAGDSAYRLLVSDTKGQQLAVGVDGLGEFEEVLATPLVGYEGLPPSLVATTPFQGIPMLIVSLRRLLEGPSRPSAPGRTPAAKSQGPLVLVVDDSVTTRTMVSGILQSQGFRVLAAADGQQGLELAHTEGLAAIVSDLQMPVMDGLEFLEKLREDSETASLPFVLLTSIDDVATFEKASGLGADRCLGKQNFSQDLLLRTLSELL